MLFTVKASLNVLWENIKEYRQLETSVFSHIKHLSLRYSCCIGWNKRFKLCACFLAVVIYITHKRNRVDFLTVHINKLRSVACCIKIFLKMLYYKLICAELFGNFYTDIILKLIDMLGISWFFHFQVLYESLKLHLTLYQRIACAQSLYLGIIKSSLVHISAGSFGCLACHDLRNEFLLIFENLEEVRIERFVGNVTIDINFGIFVTLALNSTVALLHVGRT